MKKAVYTVFVAFWAAVAAIVGLNILTMTPEAVPEQSAPRTFTMAQVAEHDRPGDCWMAIEGGVYDFTDYVEEHPARPGVLASWCGREATEGMRTKGRGKDHSPRAWRLAESYRIGKLQY